jgi:hypothetical protein
MQKSGAEKLKPKFYGPYKIMHRVGEVAYELELPEGSKIHNMFHVSCLKKVLHIKITHFDSVASVVITSVAFCSQGCKCRMLLTSVASVKQSILP